MTWINTKKITLLFHCSRNLYSNDCRVLVGFTLLSGLHRVPLLMGLYLVKSLVGMYLFWRSTISDNTGWRHEILRCLYQLYLFLLVGYPGDGYICVKIYRMTSSFICQPLGALRQSFLCQE